MTLTSPGVRSRVVMVRVAGRSCGAVALPPAGVRLTVPESGEASPAEIVRPVRSPLAAARTVAPSEPPASTVLERTRRSRTEFESSGSRRKKLVASTTSDPDLSVPVPSPGARRAILRTFSAGFSNSSLVNLAGVSVKVAPFPSRCSRSRILSVVSAARSTRVDTRWSGPTTTQSLRSRSETWTLPQKPNPTPTRIVRRGSSKNLRYGL